MSYLYDDGTPFPLDENFVETLAAATDTCVALLKLDDVSEKLFLARQDAVARARREQAEIEAIGAAVESALARYVGDGEAKTESQTTAQMLKGDAQAVLKRRGQAIAGRRDAAIREVEKQSPGNAVLKVLTEFFRRYQLPDTTWRLRWKARGEDAPYAQLHAATPVELQALFELLVPHDHLWRRAVKLEDLGVAEEMVLPVERGGLRRGTRMSLQRLDRWYAVELVRSPEKRSMVIARGPDDAASRIEIVIDSRGRSEPTMRRTGTGEDVDREIGIRAEDLESVKALWSRVESTIGDLVSQRHKVVVAKLGKKPLNEPDGPRRLAQAIVDSIGPLAREMRTRSREPGEFTLRRDLGDGRREELFITTERLAAKLAKLRADQRALFDVFGVDDGVEPVTIDYPDTGRFLALRQSKDAPDVTALEASAERGGDSDSGDDVKRAPRASTGRLVGRGAPAAPQPLREPQPGLMTCAGLRVLPIPGLATEKSRGA